MTDRPNVLILTPEFPYPPNDGMRLRMSQAIHSISVIADITLISFIDFDVGYPELPPYDKLQTLMGVNFIVRVEKPRHTKLKRIIEKAYFYFAPRQNAPTRAVNFRKC